ncbi:MAG TPA: universal stress protein [Kofleriaceae bacterium]|nr:universal stress protein [Kofleriaceae bacterium]
MLPKIVLVPIDFSANAEQALDYAAELARKLGATVHLVHAIASLPSALPVALTEQMIENLVTEHREALDKLVKTRRTLATFGPPTVEVGDARDTIIGAAKALGADLIVMGTHGRRGLSRMVMGSVAENVLRHAPCPVLIIRAKHDES